MLNLPPLPSRPDKPFKLPARPPVLLAIEDHYRHGSLTAVSLSGLITPFDLPKALMLALREFTGQVPGAPFPHLTVFAGGGLQGKGREMLRQITAAFELARLLEPNSEALILPRAHLNSDGNSVFYLATNRSQRQAKALERLFTIELAAVLNGKDEYIG